MTTLTGAETQVPFTDGKLRALLFRLETPNVPDWAVHGPYTAEEARGLDADHVFLLTGYVGDEHDADVRSFLGNIWNSPHQKMSTITGPFDFRAYLGRM